MIVKELIDILSKLPPNAVIISEYETLIDDYEIGIVCIDNDDVIDYISNDDLDIDDPLLNLESFIPSIKLI